MNTPSLPEWSGTANPILPTASMDRTVDFYEGIGFQVRMFRDGGYAYVTSSGGIDGVILHFSLRDGFDPFVAAGMAYIMVPDAEKLHSQILATGIVPEAMTEDNIPKHSTRELKQRWRRGESLARITRPWDQPWGMREFALIDPDNNLLRIGHVVNASWPNP